MTLNLINRVEHQRKEIPPISGILKRHYRGKKKFNFTEKNFRDFNFMNNFFREIVIFLDFFFVVMTLLTMFPVIKIVVRKTTNFMDRVIFYVFYHSILEVLPWFYFSRFKKLFFGKIGNLHQ